MLPAEPVVTLYLSLSTSRDIHVLLEKDSNKQGKIEEAEATRVTVPEFVASVRAKKTTEKLVLIGKNSSAETAL